MSRHSQRIDEICSKLGARRAGFRRTIVRECAAEYLDDYQGGVGVVPDAYVITDCRDDDEVWWMYRVTAIEVEETSPVTPDKMVRYQELFWILDQDYIALEVLIADRLGGEKLIPWKDLRDSRAWGRYDRVDGSDGKEVGVTA